jgi:hypothetical protein
MRSTILTVVLFASLVVAAPVPKAAKARKEMLPLTLGNRWEYISPDNPCQVIDIREVTAVEEKDGATIVTQKYSNTVQTLRVDATGTTIIRTGNSDLKSPRVILKPDIREGDSWEWDAGGYTEVRTIGKAETIKTPAGEFESVPIHYRYVQNGQDIQKGTIWYAAGVGLVRIDYSGQTSQVLKSFTPGDGKK